MKIDIISLFPKIAISPLDESIMSRARARGIVGIRSHNLRDWATDKHKKCDDYLCGGGPGMLLKPEPIFAAVEDLASANSKVVLLTPQGVQYNQAMARGLAEEEHLIFICGHYEGVDHRVVDQLVDIELSLGDYILTNGGLAAAVVIDSVVRLLPEALGDERSWKDESFSDPFMLESPAYTKPRVFRGLEVPEVFFSGHHEKIESWKKEKALERTMKNRPDLLK